MRALVVFRVILLAALAVARPWPVAAADGTPVAGPGGELFATVTLPAEAIPPGALAAYAWHFVAQPGASETWIADPTQPGVEANFVLDGSYAVRVDGPLRIVRGDGTTEEPAPGTEATLGPGDAWIDLDVAAAHAFRNAGRTPAVFAGIGVWAQASTTDRATGDPPGAIDGSGTSISPDGWARAGPLTVTLRRVTLAPGERLPPTAERLPTLRFVESGRLSREIAFDDASPTAGAPLVYPAGDWTPWVPLEPGRQAILANDGDEPLVFLELTVAPSETAPGTPTP